ncbi:MAG: hypothetical protein KC493_04075 [Bacteriovoracaceae bacterium]|nr:hypothetical protein [Bacteriovoracaceae bacterium]
MTKKIIFLLSILFSISIGAATYIQGEGHFFAKDNDSLGFVKKQLLASAFRDVMTKELDSMGLDTKLFWQQYDKKFEDYFETIKLSLKEKYKIDDPNTSQKRRGNYQDALRTKRLRAKSSYGRLQRAIISYSIKKMSRSTQMANSRYLSLNARVDKKMLRNFYFKFTREGESRHFKTLYVSTNFNLKSMTWLDAGVEVESDFTSVVKEHWKNWLKQNLGSYVDNVELTDLLSEEKLNAYLSLPEDAGKTIATPDADADSAAPADEFEDSLWLKVTSTIQNLSTNELLGERKYKVSGDYVVLDLKTNKLVRHFDFVTESKSYKTEDKHQLSSNLASLVYRMPMVDFQELGKSLVELPPKMKRVRLTVNNLSSVQDLISLKNFLSNKGLAQRFSPSLDTYAGQTGRIILGFQGENEAVKETLIKLNNESLGNDRKMVIESPENPFILSIQKIEEEVTES